MTADELRIWLAKYSTTQQQFADFIDYGRIQVSKWCNGHAPIPKIVVLYCACYDEYARLTGVPTAEVLGTK